MQSDLCLHLFEEVVWGPFIYINIYYVLWNVDNQSLAQVNRKKLTHKMGK